MLLRCHVTADCCYSYDITVKTSKWLGLAVCSITLIVDDISVVEWWHKYAVIVVYVLIEKSCG